MIGYWKDQFDNKRKYLSCSIFDSVNDVVTTINIEKSNTDREWLSKKEKWKACLLFNIPFIFDGGFILKMPLLKKILPSLMLKDVVGVQPMKEPSGEYKCH